VENKEKDKREIQWPDCPKGYEGTPMETVVKLLWKQCIDSCIKAVENARERAKQEFKVNSKEIYKIVSKYINFHNMANTDHETVWRELSEELAEKLNGRNSG